MVQREFFTNGNIEDNTLKIDMDKVKLEKAKYTAMTFNLECKIYLSPHYYPNTSYLRHAPQINTPNSVDVSVLENETEIEFYENWQDKSNRQNNTKKILIESQYHVFDLERLLRKAAPEYASKTSSGCPYPLIGIPEEKVLSIIKNLNLKVKE